MNEFEVLLSAFTGNSWTQHGPNHRPYATVPNGRSGKPPTTPKNLTSYAAAGISDGLLRQYFPKGTDLSVYTEEDLDFVASEMNDRPRKRLNYAKPNEMIKPLLLR